MFSSILEKVNNNDNDIILPVSISRRNFLKNLAIGSSLLMVGGTGTARSAESADVHHKNIARAVSEASEICHHPFLNGKPQTHLCRGSRDF